MGLTEVPCELFRMKNLKQLALFNNQLMSLPPELGLLTNLKGLFVRHSTHMDRNLTHVTDQGHVQPCSRRCLKKSANLRQLEHLSVRKSKRVVAI